MNEIGLITPTTLAFCSAFLFAVGVQVQNLGLIYGHNRLGALISILGSTVFYWLLSPLFLQTWYWMTSAVLIFAVIGLFRPFLSANFALAAVRYLGPTLTSALASTAPLFAVLFAILILGESLTLTVFIATLAIVIAVGILTQRGETKGAWPTWALLLPIGAAAVRALGHAMTKLGLTTVPAPLFAGLESYTVSLAIALITMFSKDQRIYRDAKWSPGLLWFFAGGVVYGISIWSLNTALNLGSVITVVPIVSLSPIFTFLLGFLIFRRETFTFRIILAMLLVVPGVILIAIAD